MALECKFAIGTAQQRPTYGAEFLRLCITFFMFLRVLTLCPDWSEYCDLLLVARLFEVVVTGAIACRFISCGTCIYMICGDMCVSPHVTKYQKRVYCLGVKVFNMLPSYIKTEFDNPKKCKVISQKFLYKNSLYI